MAPKGKPAAKAPAAKKTIEKKKGPKVRDSIKPGTILILLSGRFRGKRAICVKALESGLLLVTGPMKINGVPLRRVNQRYVIATSTTVPLGKLDTSKFDDKYFKRTKDKKKKTEGEFFATEAPKQEISDTRKKDQKAVDDALVGTITKDAELKKYLKARFSLTNTTYPHMMKF
eukprot:gnl/MRDRNA2_/MRDRNA2_89334_c0_seq1.p2 gnl/MRDRNA2_/MRDRNA2_89334_c0~~gnl/MRDRNA2_/MRDRNA2_89334_c0_seq1.p2  ORF type:complete len:173 (-),score=41.09 gnl/MRDRNA2_/MRDRNA2_89334_c0_seq1:13-531(-)